MWYLVKRSACQAGFGVGTKMFSTPLKASNALQEWVTCRGHIFLSICLFVQWPLKLVLLLLTRVESRCESDSGTVQYTLPRLLLTLFNYSWYHRTPRILRGQTLTAYMKYIYLISKEHCLSSPHQGVSSQVFLSCFMLCWWNTTLSVFVLAALKSRFRKYL